MAPPHTMSPSKHPRSGPLTKPPKHRSIIQARLNLSSYTQSFQPTLLEPTLSRPIMLGKKETIIEQFWLHREKSSADLPGNLLENHKTRRRISYTKEQKLAAVSYATTTRKANKNKSMELISKYSATANLRITTAMLQD